MDAGVSTKGLRVACVPIGDDTWVTKFVAEKVDVVILDVGKIDHVLTDGMIDYHMMRFCQNTSPDFLARNTPTPLRDNVVDWKTKRKIKYDTHAPYFRFTWQLGCSHS